MGAKKWNEPNQTEVDKITLFENAVNASCKWQQTGHSFSQVSALKMMR